MSLYLMWIVTVMSILIPNLVSDSLAGDTNGLHKISQNYALNKIGIKLPFPYKNLKVAVDDFDNIYIAYDGSVFVYDKDGKNIKKMKLLITDYTKLGRLIEVSSAGDTIFIKNNGEPYNRLFVFNDKGELIKTINYDSIYRISHNNIYRAEKYSFGKKIETDALDSKLDKIYNYNSHYLTNMNLNQKPVGFIDDSMNLYYMLYAPELIKVDKYGKVISQQKVPYKAENWRLIGIDSKEYLYALVNNNGKSEILQFGNNLKIMSHVELDKENITNVIDSAEEDGAEIDNYTIISNGNIYLRTAYPKNKKTREYVIYKFEQQLPK